MKRVLVVDDEQSMCEMLAILLRKEGFEVVAADSRAQAAAVLARGPVEMVITDLRLPDGDGIDILRQAKSTSPETSVIVMTAFGSTESAVAALKLGALDYLIKPFDVEELRIVVRNSLERKRLQEENTLLKAEFESQHALEKIVGTSAAMTSVFKLLRAVAPTGSTVLITGESGTGKELVAKAIHALSPRKNSPFVSINCGALPETLLESELFGHVKGSFTDAYQHRKGLFEAAHRGTLFLDEVGETPPAMQVKLLRVLQERKLRRVGGTDEIEVDVRLIAATNRALDLMVKERQFREDLFYRLAVIPIRIPPLRERCEDIPLLAEHFLRQFGRAAGKALRGGIAPEALARLTAYPWPGNVRELENVIERAVALESGDWIRAEHLPEPVASPSPAAGALPGPKPGFSLDGYLHELEASLVRKALSDAEADRGRAAILLGVTPRSLRYLIRKHGLEA